MTVLASSMLSLNHASYSWEDAMLGGIKKTGDEKLGVGMIIVYVYEIPGDKRKNLISPKSPKPRSTVDI